MVTCKVQWHADNTISYCSISLLAHLNLNWAKYYKTDRYRWASLFAVDTYRYFWTVKTKFADKKTQFD